MPASPSIQAEVAREVSGRSNEDSAARIPLLLLSVFGAAWFVASAFLLFLSAMKMHGPNLGAAFPFLSYGRLQPAAMNAFLYGFLSQAGAALGIWILARTGKTKVALPAVLSRVSVPPFSCGAAPVNCVPVSAPASLMFPSQFRAMTPPVKEIFVLLKVCVPCPR